MLAKLDIASGQFAKKYQGSFFVSGYVKLIYVNVC